MTDDIGEGGWQQLWSEFVAVAPDLDIPQWNSLLDDVEIGWNTMYKPDLISLLTTLYNMSNSNFPSKFGVERVNIVDYLNAYLFVVSITIVPSHFSVSVKSYKRQPYADTRRLGRWGQGPIIGLSCLATT